MIRRADAKDIDSIILLETALFDNPMSERMLQHELARGQGWIYGDFVGYVLMRKDNGLVDVTRLGVREDHRRKGIGGELLAHILLDVPDAILTVKKNNAAAMKLYDAFGFKIVAHLNAAAAFVMRRTVTSSE